MYTFSIVNPSLISEEKKSHILEQKYTEFGKMSDMIMLIMHLPQKW